MNEMLSSLPVAIAGHQGATGTKRNPNSHRRRDVIGRQVRGRRRVPAAARGQPHFFVRAGPRRTQWAEPAGAGGVGGPPSEGWAAPSGGRAAEARRSTGGAAPADDTSHQ